jgi:hypothetical protein
MDNDKKKTEGVPAPKGDYYEAIASHKQIYLHDVQGNLREILESDGRAVIRKVLRVEERLDHAVEELIQGIQTNLR